MTDRPARARGSAVDTGALDVIVVGAGFSGLCIAHRLLRAGLRFVVLEQAATLGGTWRDNHYPGAACDVPSRLYSLSFAPNPDWSRAYPHQRELQAYLERVADEHGLRPHLRVDARVRAARFDPARNTWRVAVAGDDEEIEARALVLGTGFLTRPRLPDIEGLATFAGPVLHTARWRHDVPLAGRRVAVIGTGASAIQVVPAIAPEVARLTVFQRSAPWVLPKHDPAIPAWRRRAYRRWPLLERLVRGFTYARMESRAIAFTRATWLTLPYQAWARTYLRLMVRDPVLRRRLTPDYRIGCKRALPSSDYLATLCRPNVALVSDAIERVTRTSIVTTGGVEHACDVIVAATGFNAAEAGAPFPISGVDGADLDETWRDGASAYLGTTVPGFPNLYVMIGPNTGLGHNSMIYMIESQANYVMSALAAGSARRGRAPYLRADVHARYNAHIQARLRTSVWNTGGCRSWYLTRNGLNTTLWPDFTFVYRRRTRRFDAESYEWLPEDAPEATPARGD